MPLSLTAKATDGTHAFGHTSGSGNEAINVQLIYTSVPVQLSTKIIVHWLNHKLQPKPLRAEQPQKPVALEHSLIQPTG